MPASVVVRAGKDPRDCSRGQPENSEHECEIVIAMSALGSIREICSALGDVRLTPTPAAAAKRFLFAAGAGLAISGARPFDR